LRIFDGKTGIPGEETGIRERKCVCEGMKEGGFGHIRTGYGGKWVYEEEIGTGEGKGREGWRKIGM